MIKKMRDGLSSGLLKVTDVWGKNKLFMCPKIIYSDADDFTVAGKKCLTRELLETERSFFGNAEEIAFSEIEENCEMSLSDLEIEILLLDKRT